MLLIAVLAALLVRLHRKGVLFPGLSAWQFFAVLLAILLALAGIEHLVSRRRARGR
jgi:hypothetical protein